MALGLNVPGYTETGISAPSAATLVGAEKYDIIEMKNGDTITGNITNDKFSIQTSYALLSFKREELQRIQVEGAGTKQDSLTLFVGDRLSGVLQDTELRIQLVSGAEVVIEKDKILSIRMHKK